MNKDDLYKNLVVLLKVFKNRPYHLAKYLTDNSAFSQEFINKIMNSDKLKELSKKDEEESDPKLISIYFTDINQMNDFYSSLIDDIKSMSANKTINELTSELNLKLDNCIKNEQYEDAARLRDYMIRNNIKRINNF